MRVDRNPCPSDSRTRGLSCPAARAARERRSALSTFDLLRECGDCCTRPASRSRASEMPLHRSRWPVLPQQRLCRGCSTQATPVASRRRLPAASCIWRRTARQRRTRRRVRTSPASRGRHSPRARHACEREPVPGRIAALRRSHHYRSVVSRLQQREPDDQRQRDGDLHLHPGDARRGGQPGAVPDRDDHRTRRPDRRRGHGRHHEHHGQMASCRCRRHRPRRISARTAAGGTSQARRSRTRATACDATRLAERSRAKSRSKETRSAIFTNVPRDTTSAWPACGNVT